jgi:putative membrane protein
MDPILIGSLVAAAAVYAPGSRGRQGPTARQQPWFYPGWTIAALALISPLCNLSVALFSARVGQHSGLSLVAAPRVALGRPGAALTSVFPKLVWMRDLLGASDDLEGWRQSV